MSGTPPLLFDRAALARQRQRRAAGFAAHDFLVREVAERLADRLDDVRRRFPVALDLGCRDGLLGRVLAGRGGIELLVQADLAPAMAGRAAQRGPAVVAPALVADEELLPFGPGSFDLVLSCLNLHWVNDLPGTLAQIRYALKPDGLFLAALFGGGTLGRLRQALVEGEAAARGGASPRVPPFVELRDAAHLLQRAGFALPVADGDRIPVDWPDPLSLMRDLAGMGEANVLAARPRHLAGRGTLLAAAERYPRRADGRVVADFEIVYLTAWAPHASQQRPLRPGSATSRLATALGSREEPAGERAPIRPR
jgi:NADH dehydrogenase [ubiquinone] 1 alpha subcomplex assembly factor 5